MSITQAPRRAALKILGAIGSTCIFPFQADELYGQQEHHEHATGKPVVYQPQLFKEKEFQLLSAFVDVIIPETNTPSASGAGVPSYIDYVASNNKRVASTIRKGLRHLNRKKFLRMNPAEREALARELCDAAEVAKTEGSKERFWIAVKNLTADGYYTSQAGMRDELGYKGGSVLESFPDPEAVTEH